MEEAEVESCSLESSMRDVCRRGMACLPGLWPAALTLLSHKTIVRKDQGHDPKKNFFQNERTDCSILSGTQLVCYNTKNKNQAFDRQYSFSVLETTGSPWIKNKNAWYSLHTCVELIFLSTKDLA